MSKFKPTLAAAVAAILLASAVVLAGAQAASAAPAEVLYRFQDGHDRVLGLPAGVDAETAAAALASNPRVDYAAPNFIAHAAATTKPITAGAAYIPDDPGLAGTAGGWQAMQWNLLPCGSLCDPAATPLAFQSRGGINMPQAWGTMAGLGRAGGLGVKVAVLDTGVAYRAVGAKVPGSPDFTPDQFVPGRDFVDHDRIPVDEDGHGTHIAGTIAEQTGNGTAVTGIAYGAKVMPVRVLNSGGFGRARDIGAGIAWAAKHGAQVINMSFEFGPGVKRCSDIPTICRAVRVANARGAVVVAAAGNDFHATATYPARIPGVIGVGGATEGACIGNYSNVGKGVDLFAPGGQGEGRTPCQSADRSVFQLTFTSRTLKTFGYPTDYSGTSMAAAHASGVAALVIASGELTGKVTPLRIECQLEKSARKSGLGQPYRRAKWGAGLLDAAGAVAGARC
jgi:serine protease